MELFARLSKFDEYQGIATGIAAAEELDHDREIMDYAGSKPYFQQWSTTQKAMTSGRSLGNVRLQHDASKVAGKLLALDFDDANKRIIVQAQIVDPVAKELLRTGCLSGFSIGGDYGKRTPMGNGVEKYIAIPSEISVVDRPCMPSATFTHVKSNGQIELKKFRSGTNSVTLLKTLGVGGSGVIMPRVYSPRRLEIMRSRGYQS